MTLTASPAALAYLHPTEHVLTRQIRIGRPVAELAAELAADRAAGGLTADEIEAGLWTFVRDDLDREADAYGRQVAGTAGDDAADEWPAERAVNAGSVLGALGQRTAPPYVLRQIERTVREAYAESRGG